MPAKLDLTGARFGRYVALSFAGTRLKQSYWLCRCDCGTERAVMLGALRSGNTTSCGCYRDEVTSARTRNHGRSLIGDPTYRAWKAMRNRCRPSHKDHACYFDRGIAVCERWNLFDNFLADMGDRPDEGLTLDRINNDGNYEPGNTRWTTRKVQGNNRRPKSEWAKRKAA